MQMLSLTAPTGRLYLVYAPLQPLRAHFSLNGLTYSNNLKLEMPGFFGLGFFIVIF